MHEVRPWWAPKILGFNFLETNLRVYVTHQGEPCVYFFSLDAVSRTAVYTARLGWILPYYYVHMSQSKRNGLVHYYSQRPSSLSPELELQYKVGSGMEVADPSSLEFFLLERYLLFTERKGKILRGQVYHTPYTTFQAKVSKIQQNLSDHIGLPLIDSKLGYVHYSPGVDVEIFPLRVCS